MLLQLIQDHPIPACIIIAMVLLGAFFLDELEWKKRSDGEVLDMVNSTDPKVMMVGLSQLRKRNQDISLYVQNVIPFLTAETAIDRVTAKMILKKHFREDYLLIDGYEGSDDLDKCKKNLIKLHAKYGVNS